MRASRLGAVEARLGNIRLGSPSINLSPTFADTLTLTDVSSAVILEFRDSIVFSDTFSEDTEFPRPFSDTLTIMDEIFNIKEGEFSDTLSFSDTCETQIWKTGDFSDVVSLVEQLLTELTVNRTITEAVEFQEVLQSAMVRLLDFSDIVNFSEVLDGVAAKVLGDTMTFSDAITAFVAKVVQDLLEFNESLSPQMDYLRGTFDQLVLYDSTSLSLVSRTEISDTLTLSDEMLGDRVQPLSQDIVEFSEAIVGERSLPYSDTLTFTDDPTLTKTVNKTTGDTLLLQEVWAPNLVVERFIEDTIEFIDVMRGLRAKTASFDDTLTLIDDILREVHVVDWTDTLSLTDSMTLIKDSTRVLDDAVVFTDGMALTKESNLAWNDLLAFADGYQVKIRTNNPISEGIRLVTPVLPTIPTGATGYIPSPIWEGVTRVLPQVVFIGAGMSVVMPAPEFNDFDANEGKIAVQRSMTGRFRVFAKRAEREKRNWRFVVPRHKAQEFRTFLLAEVNNSLTVIDWEGNYWNAKILSDSVDFTESRRWEPCGNATDVTIEIVGSRYA